MNRIESGFPKLDLSSIPDWMEYPCQPPTNNDGVTVSQDCKILNLHASNKLCNKPTVVEFCFKSKQSGKLEFNWEYVILKGTPDRNIFGFEIDNIETELSNNLGEFHQSGSCTINLYPNSQFSFRLSVSAENCNCTESNVSITNFKFTYEEEFTEECDYVKISCDDFIEQKQTCPKLFCGELSPDTELVIKKPVSFDSVTRGFGDIDYACEAWKVVKNPDNKSNNGKVMLNKDKTILKLIGSDMNGPTKSEPICVEFKIRVKHQGQVSFDFGYLTLDAGTIKIKGMSYALDPFFFDVTDCNGVSTGQGMTVTNSSHGTVENIPVPAGGYIIFRQCTKTNVGGSATTTIKNFQYEYDSEGCKLYSITLKHLCDYMLNSCNQCEPHNHYSQEPRNENPVVGELNSVSFENESRSRNVDIKIHDSTQQSQNRSISLGKKQGRRHFNMF